MGDVTLLLLDGKHRIAESVFGWSRTAVEMGINEFQTGLACVNDISARVKPKTEEKNPKLLADIQAIMEPQSESESSLRTTLLYTNMTANAVYCTVARLLDAIYEKGVKVCGNAKTELEQRLLRSATFALVGYNNPSRTCTFVITLSLSPRISLPGCKPVPDRTDQ